MGIDPGKRELIVAVDQDDLKDNPVVRRHVQERDIPYESAGWDTFVSLYADGSNALLFR